MSGRCSNPIVRLPVNGSLDIAIGTRMMLSLPGAFENDQVELVGLVQGDFLILRMPLVQGLRARFAAGEPVVMRYLARGAIYGFTSSVLCSATRPCFLLFIAFPEVLEQLELREHRRVNCLLPVTMRAGGAVIDAIMLDISLGGCQVALDVGETAKALAVGVHVELHVAIMHGSENVFMSCLSKRSVKSGDRVHVGLKFVNMSETVKQTIYNYLETVSCLI